MKKTLKILLTTILLLSLSSAVYAAPPIKIIVGGKRIDTDVAPTIVDNRILLPVRAVFEALGAKVSWIQEEQKVVATKKDTTVELVIGSNIMKINGEDKFIDVPATAVNGRTLVPLRACGEAFNLEVLWNNDARIARIKMPVSVVSREGDSTSFMKYQYDENGNMVCREQSNGAWFKHQYDELGNEIYYETSDGDWQKNSYDQYGNLIYQTDHTNFWKKCQYDENGNEVYRELSNGSWSKFHYDQNNKLILEEFSNGSWRKRYYDDFGNEIYLETSDGWWEKQQFDFMGNLTYFGNSTGYWYKVEYNENGQKVYFESSDGDWEKYSYDERGNVVYRETEDDGWWTKYQYDENDKLVYTYASNGPLGIFTYKTLYDENGYRIYYGNDYHWYNYTVVIK